MLGGKRIHPAWVRPGGVLTAMDAEGRDEIRGWLAEGLDPSIGARPLEWSVRFAFREEIEHIGNFPSLFLGLGWPRRTSSTTTAAAHRGRGRQHRGRWPRPAALRRPISAKSAKVILSEVPLLQSAGLSGRHLSRRTAGAAEYGTIAGRRAPIANCASSSSAPRRRLPVLPLPSGTAHRNAARGGTH